MILTNKYWFVFKSMSVSLDIEGKGKCYIQVLLNKKNDDKFKKVRTGEAGINMDETSHVDLIVERAKFPKRLKLIISNSNGYDDIVISNLKLGNLTINDWEKFKIEGTKSNIEGNKLILKPTRGVMTLIYSEPLHGITTVNFDIKLFIIILILTYLLAYKLTSYIADFKTIQGKSRIDIIFLTIFFIFLFIPMSRINNDVISEQENRTLAKWYPLLKPNYEINFEFGKNFNDWFNDRFYMRKTFISCSNIKLLLSKNWISKDVVKGKEEWLFLGIKDSVDNYSNSVMFTDEELQKIKNYLTQINDYCEKNNKKFYFIIAPDKSKIYGEFYNDKIKIVGEESKTEQLIDYLNKNSDIKIVYPKDKLISLKKDKLLYWKMDTHWNKLGAYYGYIELLNVIRKDFPNVNEYKIEGYVEEKHDGDLYNMAPSLLRKNDDTVYIVPNVDNKSICKYPEESQGIVTCDNPVGNKNLLMFRDSFTRALIPYLSKSFKMSKYVWKYNISPKMMDNADIIVLEVVERFLPNLVNSYME